MFWICGVARENVLFPLMAPNSREDARFLSGLLQKTEHPSESRCHRRHARGVKKAGRLLGLRSVSYWLETLLERFG